ncbi:SDR family NAD(P)-dependent oxidoreductase [Sphingobium sp. R-7]|uniref:SDR family NAD(P)-dependent oxidoreductase n=1 Tax=Sphingobium sp. R-7 TaxID=3375449 RepID=UPI00398B521C
MQDLNGRVAVITGAGTGMGRSMALSLAKEGVNLVVSDIEPAFAEAVRDEAAALGSNAVSAGVDVSKLSEVQALADLAYDRFGKVDILINNAGVTLRPFRAVWDTSYEDFQWVVGVNIWGVINGVHVFVPRMRRQEGEKHIVNVSSMGTLAKVPGHSTYVMTKAAVNGFSDVIREELKDDGFGVTVLYPGYVKTRIATSERLRPESERSDLRNVPSYESYRKADSDAPLSSPVRIADAGAMQVAIEADEVGPMVIRAIRENRPYCLTHPAPDVPMRTQLEELINGYAS